MPPKGEPSSVEKSDPTGAPPNEFALKKAVVVAKVVAVKRIEPISSSGSTANHGIALTYAWKGDNDVFTGKLTSTILSKEDEKRFRKHKEK